jgi:hypothetical protein
MELKLHYFQQVLPKSDRRRKLLNFGDTVLKTLFDTATFTDIHSLHNTLDELQSGTSDIVHPLTNQVMHIKKLDTATKVNANAVANLSATVKDIIILSYNRFQETT